MTEAQWPTCKSPEDMLKLLTDQASPRKLRLHAVEVAQRFVDGRATAFELEAAGRTVAGVARVWGDVGSPVARSTSALGGAAWSATRSSAWIAAWDAAYQARSVARDQMRGTDW